MTEPGFYERIDLGKGADELNMILENLGVDNVVLDEAAAMLVIEAVLVGVQPATVEETGRMFPDPNRKGILVYRTTERRLVSEWKPVGGEET